MASRSRYPVRAVSRMVGLTPDTLRAWERLHGAVAPSDDERARSYSVADVARLQRLASLIERGHPIANIAHLSDAALGRLLASSSRPVKPAPPLPQRPDLNPLFDALKRYDLIEIESLLNRYALLLAPGEFVFPVALPVLRDIGDRWEAGALRASQEHLVSSIVQSVLGGMMRTMPRLRASTLLLATPSGERHELGLLSAGVLASVQRLHVVYLGSDVPAPDIAHAVTTIGADIVVLSATIGSTDFKALTKLSRLGDRSEIWAGGPAAVRVRDAIGKHVRVVKSLEEFASLLPPYVRS